MGLFSFGKSDLPKTSDKVWKTRTDCLKGIVKDSLVSIGNSERLVIITLFQEAHKQLVDFLTSSKVSYQVINAFSGKDLLQQKDVAIAESSSIGSLKNSISNNTKARFLILGHYPMVAVENKILETLSSGFPSAPISFCLSLDDPIFEAMGVENLRPLLESLGLKDDDFVEHAMINKAIRRALEKINQKMTSEMKANSEREWFVKNVMK